MKRGNKPMRAKCAKCGDTVEVSHLAMNLVNEVIVKSSVPVKEGKNGKVEINYDDFERAMKEKGII